MGRSRPAAPEDYLHLVEAVTSTEDVDMVGERVSSNSGDLDESDLPEDTDDLEYYEERWLPEEPLDLHNWADTRRSAVAAYRDLDKHREISLDWAASQPRDGRTGSCSPSQKDLSILRVLRKRLDAGTELWFVRGKEMFYY